MKNANATQLELELGEPPVRVRVWPGVRPGRSGITVTTTSPTRLGGVPGVYVRPSRDEFDRRVPGGFYAATHVEVTTAKLQEAPPTYGSAAYREAELGKAVEHLRSEDGDARRVDLSPGDSTRYQLIFARRFGGGWLVMWPAVQWVAILRRGSAHHGGHCELEAWADCADNVTGVSLEVIRDLCTLAIREGAL